MYGAVLGDIIGSTYELANAKSIDFELFPTGSKFTDDTVFTVAVTEKILNDNINRLASKRSYALWYKQYYKRYPGAGYGQMLTEWASSEGFYVQRSYANGGAMRVSAIGCAYDSLDKVLNEAKASCMYTHKHPETIKGANAIAAAVFLARNDASKDEIKAYIQKKFGYSLKKSIEEIRKKYEFNSRTSYTVPVSIQAFLESSSYEDAIRKAIFVGGDSDTIACMTGAISQAFYKKIPDEIFQKGCMFLNKGLRDVLDEFEGIYKVIR